MTSLRFLRLKADAEQYAADNKLTGVLITQEGVTAFANDKTQKPEHRRGLVEAWNRGRQTRPVVMPDDLKTADDVDLGYQSSDASEMSDSSFEDYRGYVSDTGTDRFAEAGVDKFAENFINNVVLTIGPNNTAPL